MPPNICECFICAATLDPPCVPVEEHKIFPVPLCSPCSSRLEVEGSTENEESEECSLCQDGGELLLCDQCPKSMCSDCLSKLGVYEEALSSTNWACPSCNPSSFSNIENKLDYWLGLNFKHPHLNETDTCNLSQEGSECQIVDCPRCAAAASYISCLELVESEISRVQLEEEASDDAIQPIMEEYGIFSMSVSVFKELNDEDGAISAAAAEARESVNEEMFLKASDEYNTFRELFEQRLNLLALHQEQLQESLSDMGVDILKFYGALRSHDEENFMEEYDDKIPLPEHQGFEEKRIRELGEEKFNDIYEKDLDTDEFLNVEEIQDELYSTKATNRNIQIAIEAEKLKISERNSDQTSIVVSTESIDADEERKSVRSKMASGGLRKRKASSQSPRQKSHTIRSKPSFEDHEINDSQFSTADAVSSPNLSNNATSKLASLSIEEFEAKKQIVLRLCKTFDTTKSSLDCAKVLLGLFPVMLKNVLDPKYRVLRLEKFKMNLIWEHPNGNLLLRAIGFDDNVAKAKTRRAVLCVGERENELVLAALEGMRSNDLVIEALQRNKERRSKSANASEGVNQDSNGGETKNNGNQDEVNEEQMICDNQNADKPNSGDDSNDDDMQDDIQELESASETLSPSVLRERHQPGEHALVRDSHRCWLNGTLDKFTDNLVQFKCINENGKIFRVSLMYSEIQQRVRFGEGSGAVKACSSPVAPVSSSPSFVPSSSLSSSSSSLSSSSSSSLSTSFKVSPESDVNAQANTSRSDQSHVNTTKDMDDIASHTSPSSLNSKSDINKNSTDSKMEVGQDNGEMEDDSDDNDLSVQLASSLRQSKRPPKSTPSAKMDCDVLGLSDSDDENGEASVGLSRLKKSTYQKKINNSTTNINHTKKKQNACKPTLMEQEVISVDSSSSDDDSADDDDVDSSENESDVSDESDESDNETVYRCKICKKPEEIDNLTLCTGCIYKGKHKKCSNTYHSLCLPEHARPDEDDELEALEWQCPKCAKKSSEIIDFEDDEEIDYSEKLAHSSGSEHFDVDGKPKTFTAAKRAEDARLKILKFVKKKTTKKAKLCAGDGDEDMRNLEKNPTLLNSHEGEGKEVHLDPIFHGKVKPHQLSGLQFLYGHVVVSLDSLSETSPGHGAVLAHSMGLGKSFQVVSFTHTIITNKLIQDAVAKTKQRLDRVLIITPNVTIQNWADEFKKWCGVDAKFKWTVISSEVDPKARLRLLDNWNHDGGVIIISYELFNSMLKPSRKATNVDTERGKKSGLTVVELFQTIGPDVLICDEGHRLKNVKSKTFSGMNLIRTNRRIILSGTPIQNNLDELHAMVSFVRPHFLNDKARFKTSFTNIINDGQAKDSSPADIKRCKQRMAVLHKTLGNICHRRDPDILSKFLPPKYENVLYIKLSTEQASLYKEILAMRFGTKNSRNVLVSYQRLASVWAHSYVVWTLFNRRLMADNKPMLIAGTNDVNTDVMGNDPVPSELLPSVTLEDPTPLLPSVTLEGPTPLASASLSSALLPSVTIDSMSRPSSASLPSENIEPPTKPPSLGNFQNNSSVSFSSIADDDCVTESRSPSPDELFSQENGVNETTLAQILVNPKYARCFEEASYESGKTVILLNILKYAKELGEKVLVFSEKLDFLTLMQKLVVKELNWSKNEYTRMDGKMNLSEKNNSKAKFEKKQNCTCMFASLKAANVGINLVAATRVVLVDQSWNPAQDVQAIFRAYRYGQDKIVHVYRLVAAGTMEEKIFNRQVTKRALSCGVSDDDQQSRKFNQAELDDIFDDSQLVTLNRATSNPLSQSQVTDSSVSSLVLASTAHTEKISESPQGALTNGTSCGQLQSDENSDNDAILIALRSNKETSQWIHELKMFDSLVGADEIELTDADIEEGEKEFERESATGVAGPMSTSMEAAMLANRLHGNPSMASTAQPAQHLSLYGAEGRFRVPVVDGLLERATDFISGAVNTALGVGGPPPPLQGPTQQPNFYSTLNIPPPSPKPIPTPQTLPLNRATL